MNKRRHQRVEVQNLVANLSDEVERFSGKQETIKVKGTVLLVDDDPLFCEVTEAMLEHLGFTVFVAAGGNEAVALFQKHHNSIDSLLIDFSMSDMNGWETIAALRKIKIDLPAILCSGFDEARVMKNDYKEQPQVIFLHKPFTMDGLKNLLNRVLVDATNRYSRNGVRQ